MHTTTTTTLDGLAAAVRTRLAGSPRWTLRTDPPGRAVVVATAAPVAATLVAAAIGDDPYADTVLGYAATRARERGAPLRAVHVWTGRAATVRARPDSPAQADLLLSAVVWRALPPDERERVEREILHDRIPVRALLALSRTVGLLVVAAGRTADALTGRTACPLAIVPPPPRRVRFGDIGPARRAGTGRRWR
ncbi:hypothetical protein [Actinoplanes sp. NBRC 101535]|uniref:universal stress protein n=1 Tax=Actinoplanes sp. NBRC 101535 TaxID=3032196 RepID=UPI00249FFB61|nr:hypothetical protein [Actinoplanes sp. NBRC 101535]GLY08718.1 hypothetical protein Acsp01_90970 [Actinoplanes sp. NBRC 101535]